LVVLHTREGESNLVIDLQPSSTLKIIQVSLAAVECRCELRQQGHSECYISSIAVGGGKLDYVVNLNESHAYSSLRSAFIADGKERVKVGVKVNHNVADCNSFSLVKGIAGAEAVGEFEGMVYVAPDAQRTDAVQTSRNIVIGDTARIQTKPQLEIYADDVKCSHGATIGQLDGEAVMYMRQRGLSEQQARRLQIEGFVNDIVLSAGDMGEVLSEELTAKLERL
jgi:Fe-S cluster assembly protein SufD